MSWPEGQTIPKCPISSFTPHPMQDVEISDDPSQSSLV